MSMETTPPPVEPAPRIGLRGWMKFAFIGSVTLNFLVLGTVVGGVIAHRMQPPPPGLDRGAEMMTFGPLGGAFNREDRQAMRLAAEGRGANFQAMQAAVQSDFSRLEAALKADPFDAAGVKAVLADMRARTLKRMDIGETLMLERLQTMTPKQRERFVERLRHGVERFSKRLEERGGGPGGPPDHDD
ncbi:Spy/CpxP family protein refolding chaperone [Rhodobacter viridis]|uniref:Spy/CpxP family protein refolding chaperone n=1 Tax=Rhodobacter viridis TaxID=1054202 RepID=A0A318U352_9RHOB|nr:periplasmic heavy metal sensor [Rhodobacter viridis]PYF09793.1 Spy/CpxP family protein refolding chaperone [Rhodobacter viridis]